MSTTELIEMYHEGELIGSELETFKKRLNSDPEFAKEFKLHKDIDKALIEKDVLVLRKQLQYAQKQVDEKKESPVIPLFNRRVFHYAAAAIAVIIIAGFVLTAVIKKPYSNEKLYSMYFKPEDALMIKRTGNPDADKVLVLAMQNYSEGRYNEALALFDEADNNMTVKFYSGISYLEIEDVEKAIIAFQSVIDNKDNLFIEQAEWYLALCYLKMDNTKEAISFFKSISTSDGFFNNKASEILKYIDK